LTRASYDTKIDCLSLRAPYDAPSCRKDMITQLLVTQDDSQPWLPL
jgi:hypothetical protein